MRSERFSLQIISGFDACQQVTVGASDINLNSGLFSNVRETPPRIYYYCRAMYNATGASLTVVFNIENDTTDYIAEIPSGQWHIVWMNITKILAAGTDSGTIRLAFFKRGKIDGTANL